MSVGLALILLHLLNPWLPDNLPGHPLSAFNPGNRLEALRDDRAGFHSTASITSGASCSAGLIAARKLVAA